MGLIRWGFGRVCRHLRPELAVLLPSPPPFLTCHCPVLGSRGLEWWPPGCGELGASGILETTSTSLALQLMRGSRPINTSPERDLKIWIDADAAPREVKDLVFRAAKRLGIETVLVANQRLQIPPGNPWVSAVWVDGGADVADRHIADHATSGDLVVTQDVPLAALLVPKGIAVLDPRGEEHTDETVGERLSVRDFMEQARIAGLVTGGPAPYDARAKQAFAGALDRVLTRLRRPA
jgi:uncharacterized protein